MFDFVVDIWKNIPGNPYKRRMLEAFFLLSGGEKFFFIATIATAALSLVNMLIGPLLYPEYTMTGMIVLYILLLLACVQLLYLSHKNRDKATHRHRMEKLVFYEKLRTSFKKQGLLSISQLKELLSVSNRELNRIRDNRNMTLNSISVVFSILVAFSTILTSRLIQSANSDTEALVFIIFACIIVLTIFFLVLFFAKNFLPLFSPRERLLIYFSKDMSDLLILNMLETTQQSTLNVTINANCSS